MSSLITRNIVEISLPAQRWLKHLAQRLGMLNAHT